MLGMLAVILLALSWIADGTGDEGDSISHFLIARHAWSHPELLLYHWGKPVFTLLASPFAQLGFWGIKLFNIGCSVVSAALAIQVARALSIKRAYLLPLLLVTVPFFLFYSLSGLTEPLFNAALMAGIYLFIRSKRVAASLIISFLPFVRSEGLVILTLVLIYIVVIRCWKHIPLLFAGHVIYAAAGSFAGKKPHWVFSEMSYAELRSGYGSGTWSWFFERMPEIYGVALTILLTLGLIWSIKKLMMDRRGNPMNRELLFLVYGSATSVFLFHVIAWAMGWFHSMGMLRVMVGIMGPSAIVGLVGANSIMSVGSKRARKYILITIILGIVISPFASRNYGFDYKRQFCLNPSQVVAEQAAEYIENEFGDYSGRVFAFEAPYISVALGVDMYDWYLWKSLKTEYYDAMPAETIIVWDDWYAPVECGATREYLDSKEEVIFLQEFSIPNPYGKPEQRVCAVYLKK